MFAVNWEAIVSPTLDAVAAVALSDAASALVIAPAFSSAVAAVGRIPAARLKANQASTLCSGRNVVLKPRNELVARVLILAVPGVERPLRRSASDDCNVSRKFSRRSRYTAGV